MGIKMNNNDLTGLESNLSSSLVSYDWVLAGQICEEMIGQIDRYTEPLPLAQSKRLLFGLRRKRQFRLMSALAEAFIRSGQTDAQIKRQYAQSLIDQGLLSAAELVLREITDDPNVSKTERLEAIGLAGRVYKQQFVSLSNNTNDRKRAFLGRSIRKYLAGFELDSASYWHSINAVALLMRGEREGFKFTNMPDPNRLAVQIVELLRANEDRSSEPPKPWEYAAMMEAQVALGKFAEAYSTAVSYTASPNADAFEINSTLRQLVEIWQIEDDEPPGDTILPILRSALLEREGGAVKLKIGEANSDIVNLEGAFGDNAPKTIKWYKAGLERTNSIARIELADGRGMGTAGLVNGKDFLLDFDGVLLMTNSHVVSVNPADSGLPPNKVRANMQGIGEVFEVDKVVWSSAQTDLDVSFLSIKGNPKSLPLPISETPSEMTDPVPRVYVIGHPNGRDLEVSLNDSRMVAANERFVHYRTPTEPGSSGSPVFDQYGWEVVALHHGGSDSLPRIDGAPGTYQANEGISMHAIKRAIQSQ